MAEPATLDRTGDSSFPNVSELSESGAESRPVGGMNGALFLQQLRQPAALISLLAAAGFLLTIAWPVLFWWRWEYTKPESYYGYAFAVPFLIGLMLWHRRGEFRQAAIRVQPAGIVVFLLSVTLLVTAVKQDMQAVMSAGLILSILSAIWFLIGNRGFRTILIPLFFLFSMAPLPGPVLNDATLGAQQLSTTVAYKILHMIGFASSRDGNIIHLDNFTLNVDVACSGFKMFLTLLTLSGALAYLTDVKPLRKWGLFLFSMPLSIFVNSIRIVMIGIVGVSMGSSAAETFHDWSGYLSIVLCMAILFGVARILGCRTLAGQPLF